MINAVRGPYARQDGHLDTRTDRKTDLQTDIRIDIRIDIRTDLQTDNFQLRVISALRDLKSLPHNENIFVRSLQSGNEIFGYILPDCYMLHVRVI